MDWMKRLGVAVAALLGAGTAWAGELGEPQAVKAGGAKIDVGIGHAAPFVCDWDGDGKQDLLVGQMGKGHLRIYRNTGSKTAPAFEDFEVFKAGESEATVPTG